jgi:GWxTD domain-containing protein
MALPFFMTGSIPQETEKNEKSLSRSDRLNRLNDIHRRWFNMTENISSKEEQSVFLQLDNDRDREIFIRTFWLQRDPTPGTTANEYKDEIEERFRHVLYTFKRGTNRPAWQSDMGRIYMVLGKPNSVSSNESAQLIYPTQVWYYYGDVSLGLPTYFSVMFYRPNNTPEWRLYNPASDTPRALIVQNQTIGMEDYNTMYQTIRETSPDVAMAAFTMIPNEFHGGLRPSWRSNFILGSIYESPQKKINVQYATNFLKYKGFVDMETSVNYIENTHLITVTRLEHLGINLLNIALKPKKISVDFSSEQDKYYYNFELAVSIKRGDEFIHEHRKNFDFYMTGQEVENLKAQGMVISDLIPVIPGDYTVLVYAKNTVGKEFTYFEQAVRVQPDSAMPFLGTPLVSNQMDDKEPYLLIPFQTESKRLHIDTDRTFVVKAKPTLIIGAYNLSKDLWQKGRLVLIVKGLSERTPYEQTLELPLSSREYRANNHYFFPLSQEGLYSDHYQVSVRMLGETGAILDSKGTDFTIAPHRNVPHPISTFKQARIENTAPLFSILGSQLMSAGDFDGAARQYSRALESDPQLHSVRVKWLETLNKLGKFTQVMVESEQLKGQKDFMFDFHLLRGTALFGLKDYENALTELLAANKQYNSDIRVLNLLGVTFGNKGDLEEGIKALEASLTLNPRQPHIQKVIGEMKTQLNSQAGQKK